jgi:hypothetical protein
VYQYWGNLLANQNIKHKAAMSCLHRFDYEGVITADDPDPHLFGVLLKEWLKRLPSPLISDYKACVEMAEKV